ncbi:MAG: hypothetical protein ACU0CO_10330 [Shimia sp.]
MSDTSPLLDLHQTLATLCDAVASVIDEELPGLQTCEGHPNRITPQVLKDGGIASPAVLVTLLGVKAGKTMAGEMVEYRASLGAFIVAKDVLDLRRDPAALVIAQRLLQIVPSCRWRLEHLGPADAPKLVPLLNPEDRKAGFALWGVQWDQPIFLQRGPSEEPVASNLYVRQNPEGGTPTVVASFGEAS